MSLIGQTFNSFTVIAKTDECKDGYHKLYVCQCECGQLEKFDSSHLKLRNIAKQCNHKIQGIRLDAITPERIKIVLSKVDATTDIFDAIRKERLSANTFFLALRKNAELNAFYQEQRKIVIEELLEEARSLVMEADSKLELEKAKTNLAYYQWKAEKLIPEAYGAKVQIDVNKTVDIRGALDEARARAGIIEATYRAVEDEVKKELSDHTPTKTPTPEPLPADSNEIDFAEMYQRSINPTAEDLLG